ncbi:MAG: shikimate kinase [Nannocystaceae bacterium]|nr:shikimate kinase [Nannocystaceae bacterium]
MKLVVFGNSGAGKSTLARALAQRHGLAHLDLDTIAFDDAQPGVRREPQVQRALLQAFVDAHAAWVIEGCYATLVAAAAAFADELVWLDPGIEACLAHNRSRPWEPHKYASKAEQDAMLSRLQAWVQQYETRDDEFSRAAHQRVFDDFAGRKRHVTSPTS